MRTETSLSARPLHAWASLRPELLWIYDRRVAPEHRQHRCDARDGQRAWLVRRGRAVLSRGSRRWEAGPGEWMFPAPDLYQQSFSEDAHVLSLHVVCRWPDGRNLFQGHEPLVVRASRHPALEREARRLLRTARSVLPRVDRDYMEQPTTLASFLRLQQATLAWVRVCSTLHERARRIYTPTTPVDARLDRVKRLVEECAGDASLPLRRLSQVSQLSPAHLDRLFLRNHGLSLRRYHQGCRLERARLLLAGSASAVKTVAYTLGFKQASHFTLWFRRLAGCTPSEYRSQGGPHG